MKAIFVSLLLLSAGFLFTACESDLPPDPNSEGPLRRGLSGQGKLIKADHANDPMIQETSGAATGPSY